MNWHKKDFSNNFMVFNSFDESNTRTVPQVNTNEFQVFFNILITTHLFGLFS